MNDKNFHLTIELLRSTTVRYGVLTVCFIIVLYFIRKWFLPDKEAIKSTIDAFNKLKNSQKRLSEP